MPLVERSFDNMEVQFNVQSLPSTLSYKDRLTMKSLDNNSYGRLYNTGTDKAVWGRLHFDAGVRTSRALRPTPPEPLFAQSPSSPFASRDGISGYVSNTSKAVYDQHTTFKTGHLKFEGTVPIENLQPLELKRYKQKHGLDYFGAIRPDAESTNQTLRMLGTYTSDFPHSERSQVFIPSGCPGGPASGSWYHPDVRLTASVDLGKLARTGKSA